MKVVAAYLLAQLGGNETPSMEDLKKILGAVGVEPDTEKIELFLSSIKGKDITELIAAGREMVAASAPSNLAAGGVVSSTASNTGASVVAVAEPKVEEKVEEIGEEDDDMGFSLFD